MFGIPFAGAGLWAAYLAAKQFGEDPADLEKLFLEIVLALSFCGAGFGLIVYGCYASRKSNEEDTQRQQHPDKPWMWRPDWAEGRGCGANKQTMVFTWGFAVFWNLISAPLLIQIPKEFIEKDNKLALLGLMFPVVGLGLLVWAVRATLRWRKFGASVFEMSAVPGVIGGGSGAGFRPPFGRRPRPALTLSSPVFAASSESGARGGRGSGNRSTTEKILWQEERTIAPAGLGAGYQGTTVPVEFIIPYECEPADESDPRNRVIWRLESSAELPGVDFKCAFELPVFKTADSSPEPIEPGGSWGFKSPSQTFDPSQATVRVGPSESGGTEFYYRAARNVGSATALTVFLVIWVGVVWLQFYMEFPVIFPIVFGAFGVLLFLAAIDLWFSTTRVVIDSGMDSGRALSKDSGRVTIRRSTLGISSTKEIPISEIGQVKLNIGMQQSQTATQSAQAYYDIEIHRKIGKKVKAGRNIKNKREAEWIVEQMQRLIAARR